MLWLKRILAPTDLSELSQAGVRLALEIGKSQGAEVTVYHVIESDGVFRGDFIARPKVDHAALIDERKGLLEAFVRENFADLRADVKMRQEVEVGVPYKKILDRAVDGGIDLIVISTHGRTGLLHCLIGSVAEMVVRLASCPVLSVQPTKQRQVMTKAA